MVLSAFVMNHGGDTFAIYECDLRETRVLPSRKIPERVDFAFRKMFRETFQSILGDASGNNRSEKPSEGGFLCISLHLIPESHHVSSKKPTVLELAAGGSSAKKAAGGSVGHLSKCLQFCNR